MKRIWILGIIASLGLMGCATLRQIDTDWIAVGPEFPPTKPQDVQLVRGRQDVTRPYGVLGMLRIKNLKPDRDTLLMGAEKARKIVASKGADAMQINQYNSAEDDATDPRISLIVYAIKYVDNLTEDDKKAIENFEVLGVLNETAN